MSPIDPAGQSGRLINSYRRNVDGVERAVERLSTGKRINRPSDDPAGFVAAEELRGEIDRLQRELKTLGGKRAAARQQESGLRAIQHQLIELRGALAGLADNLLTDAEREAYGQEITAGLEAIDRLRQQLSEAPAPTGATVSRPSSLSIEVRDSTAIPAAADAVDSQIDEVQMSRAGLAAFEKYHIAIREQIVTDSIVTHTAALSQIEDADFAEEASNLALSQVLVQSSLAALAYSQNSAAEQVLDLVENLEQGSVADG